MQSCRACVALQDPYCRWSLRRSRCVSGGDQGEEDVGSTAQDVNNGEHAACAEEEHGGM